MRSAGSVGINLFCSSCSCISSSFSFSSFSFFACWSISCKIFCISPYTYSADLSSRSSTKLKISLMTSSPVFTASIGPIVLPVGSDVLSVGSDDMPVGSNVMPKVSDVMSVVSVVMPVGPVVMPIGSIVMSEGSVVMIISLTTFSSSKFSEITFKRWFDSSTLSISANSGGRFCRRS